MKISPKLASKIEERANKLLEWNPRQIGKIKHEEIPDKCGVYLVYNHQGDKIIYVGMGTNLRVRIKTDHSSGEKKASTSTLRRKVAKSCGVPFGNPMREWIEKCWLAFIEVEDEDLCNAVEMILIASLRLAGQPLLNSKSKKRNLESEKVAEAC